MPHDDPTPVAESFASARTLIQSRANLSARRLQAPGPDGAELQALLELAAAAPDHAQLTPWRFVIVPPAARSRLGEVFAQALSDRDPQASADQLQAARDKAQRAPVLLVAIARLGPSEPDIPAAERLVSLGAAIQNMLLGAHALGYGSGLTSGKAMRSPRLAAWLGLAEGEEAVCCINIGTAAGRGKGRPKPRPRPAEFSQVLGPV